ncbi:MAG TPA: ABC transporter substrate-binding protein, partial [Gaiellales bacterium]
MRRPFAIALLVAMVAAGCGFKHEPTGALAPRFPITVNDAAGRSVTIAREPTVVLALDPAAVRILRSIGAPQTPVDADASIATLKARHAGLIVMSPDTTPERADEVEHALGVPTYVLAGFALPSIEHGAAELGLATGHALAGRNLSLHLRDLREKLQRSIANAKPQTVFADTGFGYSIAGSGDLLAALVKAARGTLVGTEPPQPVSLPRLQKLDPDVYLTMRSSHVTLAILAKRKLTAHLPAVVSGRVLIIDDRLVAPDQDAYRALAQIARFL